MCIMFIFRMIVVVVMLLVASFLGCAVAVVVTVNIFKMPEKFFIVVIFVAIVVQVFMVHLVFMMKGFHLI